MLWCLHTRAFVAAGLTDMTVDLALLLLEVVFCGLHFSGDDDGSYFCYLYRIGVGPLGIKASDVTSVFIHDTLSPEQNGPYIVDSILNCLFFN